jgi:hypothetical protein
MLAQFTFGVNPCNYPVQDGGNDAEIPTTNHRNYVLFVMEQHRGVHMRKAAIATAVIAGLAFSAQPASAQFCMAGIIVAAFYANATENRELSATEASTCGLFYGADRDKAVRGGQAPGAKAKKPAAKTAAKAKPQ